MWRPAPSVFKWNKIINFVLSVKLWVTMHFLQDPLNAYIFYPNRFICVLPKKTRSKYLLATHDYYFMFKTFFSQMNNHFFWWSIPSTQAAWNLAQEIIKFNWPHLRNMCRKTQYIQTLMWFPEILLVKL